VLGAVLLALTLLADAPDAGRAPDPDQDLIDQLEVIERLELLENLELFEPDEDEKDGGR
jgi:hypothetical protein